MVQWNIEIIWKVVFITLSSFSFTVLIYWFLIRPFNLLRLVFGMKMIPKENFKTDVPNVSKPVFILSENDLEKPNGRY